MFMVTKLATAIPVNNNEMLYQRAMLPSNSGLLSEFSELYAGVYEENNTLRERIMNFQVI